jgi:hypothetical protein
MPIANRVDPFGTLFETEAHGTLMGNRGGRFHDPETHLAGQKHWATRQWICCEISFRGRKRSVWGKSYTELFFSDDIAALAAGHRPCFECRNADAKVFSNAWGRATSAPPPKAAAMDRILHEQRLHGKAKRLHRMDCDLLPDGVMILIDRKPHALRDGAAYPWHFSNHGSPVLRPKGDVDVLTPPAIVSCLAHGYQPR